MDERLKRLIARREQAAEARRQLHASRTALVDNATAEAREDLSPEEDEEFRKLTADIKDWDTELSGFDERISELSAEMERDRALTTGAAAVRRARATVTSVTEEQTYTRGNGKSYLFDLARVQCGLDGGGNSMARLQRHALDVQTSPEYRAPMDRVDGTGGYFVPPAWLIDQYVALARASRATADVVNKQVLPANTDSINIPRILTGTSTAIQTASAGADGGTVNEGAITDAVVTAPVCTIAGQATIAQQLLDQSPINFDEVIFKDLAAAYATNVDTQVISGLGTTQQVKGILAATGIIPITYTDTAPTVAAAGGFYTKLNDAVQRVHTQRFAAPTVIVMHPRRWAWVLSASDTTYRPLVVPNGPAFNQPGTSNGVLSQQIVGTLVGLPVVTDPSIPTTLPSASNQDIVLVMKADDLILWESSVRTRALPEILSGTLQVRLQLYGYIAFTAERQPKSVVTIGGTAFAPPAF